MNTVHKIAKHAKRISDQHIKDERLGIESIIAQTASEGEEQVDTFIYYSKNVEYLKNQRFKVTPVDNIFTRRKYNISWRGLI